MSARWFIFFLFVAALEAKTVCLNMIVKNESEVIERCLNSCKDWIDYWVIVDTGSTDGTQEKIKKFMKDKPGELHERPWVDFAHNRNQAFQLAKNKADYLLFIDADELLRFDCKIDKKTLSKPYYCSIVQEPDVRSIRVLLVNTAYAWDWVGVIHEGLAAPGVSVDYLQCLDGVCKVSNTKDGFRSKDPNKYLKDAQVLEKALQKEPDKTRYAFYLAQCYINAEENLLALKSYEKRAQMQGAEEERWYSFYMAARLHQSLNYPSEVITREFCRAFQERNYRAEPLGYLAHYHYSQGNAALAYALTELALQIPRPLDVVFVEDWFYDYGFRAIHADAAVALGMNETALRDYRKVLECKQLPSDVREKVTAVLKTLENIEGNLYTPEHGQISGRE